LSIRLALGLAVLLLALALARWGLGSAAESVEMEPASRLPQPAPAIDVGVEPLAEVELPVIEIPEYVPPRITERPPTPVEFSAHEVEVDLGMPQIGGAIDASPAPLSEP
jgi:hypothetical protein